MVRGSHAAQLHVQCARKDILYLYITENYRKLKYFDCKLRPADSVLVLENSLQPTRFYEFDMPATIHFLALLLHTCDFLMNQIKQTREHID